MVGQSDKCALDIEERVTELKFCGIPVEWALINCGMGSKQGLCLLGPGLGKLYACVEATVICTSETCE